MSSTLCTIAYKKAIDKHLRSGDWFVWVNMEKGTVAMPSLTSLDAYYPGLLVRLCLSCAILTEFIKYCTVLCTLTSTQYSVLIAAAMVDNITLFS